MHELRIFLAFEPHESKRGLLKLLALAVVVAMVEIVSISLLFPLLAVLTNQDTRWFSLLPHFMKDADRVTLFVALIAIFSFLYTIKASLQIYYYHSQTRLVARSQAALATRLLRNYMLAPYSVFLKRHSSEVIRTIVNSVQEVYGQFLNAVLTMAADMTAAIALVVLSLILAPGPALIAGLLIIAIQFAQHRVLRSVQIRLGGEKAEMLREEILLLQQALDAFREARVSRREAFFISDFGDLQASLAKNISQFEFSRRVPTSLGELAIVVSIGSAVLILLGTVPDFGSMTVTIGLLAAIAFRLSPIGNRLVVSAGTIHHAREALKTISDELTSLENGGKLHIAVPRLPLQSNIALQNVSYRYDTHERFAIAGISLTIERGETIGVVGPSGAGKSTLVDVILGLLSPTEGTVSVDDQERAAGFCLHAAYVPQRVALFDNSLLSNIAFGIAMDEVDEARMSRALTLAGLNDIVRRLPDGLQTKLGENGRLLSGGERQRVGIARALYMSPDLLVMDEPTSAMDIQSEAQIAKTIAALHGAVTILIISHRFSSLQSCDRIIFLDQGNLVDFGPIEDLQRRCPEFKAFTNVVQAAPNENAALADK